MLKRAFEYMMPAARRKYMIRWSVIATIAWYLYFGCTPGSPI